MSNYRAGDVIRLTRMANGISQEELSNGICSVQTLHRIEHGKTRVKKELYYQLMTRMERIPEKNYAVCVGKDMELLEERTLFEQAMEQYEYEKADTYVQKMKVKADDNPVTRQYMAKAEALVDYYCGRSDMATLLKRMEEAVRITLPDYEECLKKEYPFTEQEIMNLMSLANSYSCMDQEDKAVHIYEKLLKTLDMGYIFGEYVDHMKITIMRNLAIAYDSDNIGECEKALFWERKAFEAAIKNNEGRKAGILLIDIALTMVNQIKKGERDSSDESVARETLKQAYYIAIATGSRVIAENAKRVHRKEFKEELEV